MRKLLKEINLIGDIYLNISFSLLAINALVLSSFAKLNPYFPFDILVTKSIQSINYQWFDVVMQIVSLLGEPIPAFLMVFTLSVYLIHKKNTTQFLYLLFSTSWAVAISIILKFLIARPRPTPDLVIQAGNFLNPDSFPSGHVMFFLGFFGFIFFLTYKGILFRSIRTLVLVKTALLILLVGISRIYLGAHWFSDVLGAYFVGTLWLWMVCYFYTLKSSSS